MCKNKRKLDVGKIITILISLLILIKIYYELKIFDLLLGICKLELRRDSIASVSNKSLLYMVKEGTDDSLFFGKMKQMGWNLSGIYGRGYLFDNRGEEILVTKRKHFRYFVYEIQGKSFFLDRIGKLA